LGETVITIFRVEEYAKQETSFMLVSCSAYSSSLNVEVIDFAQWTFHRLHGMISQKIEL
jgi:hypothetical protein